MYCATVVYSNKPGAEFDFDYYLNQHVPMVAGFFGTSIEVENRDIVTNGLFVAIRLHRQNLNQLH